MEPKCSGDCDDKLSMAIDADVTMTASASDNDVDQTMTTLTSAVDDKSDVDDKSLPPVNILNDPLNHDPDKPLRQVRSHPSLGGRTVIPPGSLGSLAMTRSLKNNFNKTGMATAVPQPGKPQLQVNFIDTSSSLEV